MTSHEPSIDPHNSEKGEDLVVEDSRGREVTRVSEGGRSRVDTRQKPYPQPRARSARERTDGTNRPDSVEARERENPSVHARAKERTRERASERHEG